MRGYGDTVDVDVAPVRIVSSAPHSTDGTSAFDDDPAINCRGR